MVERHDTRTNPQTRPAGVAGESPRRRSRSWWTAAQIGVGIGLIVFLVARFGGDPVRTALAGLTPWPIAGAFAAFAIATVCVAARWCVISRSFGLTLRFPQAFAAYYASQLLNATLPGGVLGDVNRAVRFGRFSRRAVADHDTEHRPDASAGEDADAALPPPVFARAVRSVVWDRFVGQIVQIAATLVAAATVTSPLRGAGRITLGAVVVAVAALWMTVAVARPSRLTARIPQGGRLRRSFAALRTDWRALSRSPRAAFTVLALSVGAFAGYTAVFVIGAIAIGVAAPALTLIWAGLIVLAFAAIPLNIAGFGPREGAAAWVFGVIGLTGAQGLAASLEYGLLTIVAALPGAIVLLSRVVRVRRH